jgi:CPA2 family monovalent cation:H+ antiporter-2
MYALASSYDPDVPPHENEEYVRRAKDFLARDAEVMKGNSAAFGTRLDRGWVPPTLEDLEAELAKDPDEI